MLLFQNRHGKDALVEDMKKEALGYMSFVNGCAVYEVKNHDTV